MKFDLVSNSALTAGGLGYTQVAAVASATGELVKTNNGNAVNGRCVRILVVAGTGTLDVYDGASTGGVHVYSRTSVTVGDIYLLDIPCSTGIYVQVGANTTVTVIWS